MATKVTKAAAPVEQKKVAPAVQKEPKRTPPVDTKKPSNEVSEGMACAALAYLFPIGLIWYLADPTMRKNTFAGFHVAQSLAAFIIVAAGLIIGSIPVIGWLVAIVAWIACVIWFVQGLVNALGGRKQELWLVGPLGRRFKF